MNEATDKCLTIASKFMDIDQIIDNKLVYDILINNLNLIYEIFLKLDTDFKNSHRLIEWHKFDLYKNQIQSDLFQLDKTLIWEIISSQLPNLKIKIMDILQKNIMNY